MRTVVSPAVAFDVPMVFVAPPVLFAALPSDDAGHWVTHEGQHLFIPDGGGASPSTFAPKLSAAAIKDAAVHYTRHGEAAINGHLREGHDAAHPAVEHLQIATEVHAVDQFIAKSKPLAADTTVYRGLHQSAVAAFGLDKAPKEAIGMTFGDRAFVSTSADEQEAKAFAGAALLHITLPAGTRVGNLSSVSKFPAEEERLLPRDSVFRITGVDMGKKLPVVHCTLEPKSLPPARLAKAKKGSAAMSDDEDRQSRYVWQADDLVILGKGGK